jgi:predicted AAA+ superfamily ATPase
VVSKELLRTVVLDQRAETIKSNRLVKRKLSEKLASFSGSSALVLMGVRRCGKSTALKQLVREKFKENFFYLNFDDERLAGFEASDFQTLMEVFFETSERKPKAILLDEVQNISGWELFVNRLLRGNFSVFVTGSNANLLSRELGTHLTGRHTDYELYPFSFSEFLESQKIAQGTGYSTAEKTVLLKAFGKYLYGGGMPEAVVENNKAILGQIVEDVIQKDIIRRHEVRKPNELRSVLRFLVWNAANPITFKSISNNFGIKSQNTVQKYASYAEETFLVFLVNKFEAKLKQFDKNPKKVYCVDNGILSRYYPSTLHNRGNLLENFVAIELKRRGKKFNYYENKNGSETDFVVLGDDGRVAEAIQVCIETDNPLTAEREEKALSRTMEETKLKEGTIITMDREETKKKGKQTINYEPAWKWAMGK